MNQAQTILLASYPDIDLLPFDSAAEAEQRVEDGETGDTLFDFLWRELGEDESRSSSCSRP
jgi:hypothetical protein